MYPRQEDRTGVHNHSRVDSQYVAGPLMDLHYTEPLTAAQRIMSVACKLYPTRLELAPPRAKRPPAVLPQCMRCGKEQQQAQRDKGIR